MRRLTLTLALLGTLAAGCGGRDAEPEDVNKLAGQFTGTASPVGMPLSKDQSTCVARLYLESDLSDEALAALHKGEPLAPKTEDDREEFDNISKDIAKNCLT